MTSPDPNPSQLVELQRNELEELRHRIVELQRNDLVCRVVLGLAHDINNLLHIAGASTGLMRMYLKGHSTALKDLERIDGATQRASSMLRRALDILRRKPEGRKRLSLGRAVTELQGLLVGLCGAGVTVTVSLQTDEDWIVADRMSLDQLLLNLAVNARDAMPQGGSLHLRVGTGANPGGDPRERAVILEVEDTGQGMSKEAQAHVFTPFFTTKKLGTGLGLTVVKAIVESHKGSLTLDSTEGQGTLFRLYFRAADSSEKAPPVASGVDGE